MWAAVGLRRRVLAVLRLALRLDEDGLRRLMRLLRRLAGRRPGARLPGRPVVGVAATTNLCSAASVAFWGLWVVLEWVWVVLLLPVAGCWHP